MASLFGVEIFPSQGWNLPLQKNGYFSLFVSYAQN
jgi:hypothetical protein